jgi:hypothetical protein
MSLKLIHFFAIAGMLMFTACTPITETPAATSTPDLSEPPVAGTPVGLLPATAEPSAEPASTMQPVDLSDSQRINTPELGLQFVIPSTWTADHVEELLYIIRDQDDTSMMQVSYATGFSPGGDPMQSEMRSFMLRNHFQTEDFTIEQSVVSAYNYVVVSGPGLDACQYRYVSDGFSWLAIKFERPLCEEGDLNDTAFAILRSISLTLPGR